jgi:enamine deaminase RidA (YjgF/YER057c/UK114 family)
MTRPEPAIPERRNVSSGGPWEAIIGYSRAVRVGPIVHVSGSTSMTPDGFVGEGDPYVQAKTALATITAALRAAGARPEHVVRTRMYLTRIADWEAIGRAHGEAFGDVRPAATMVEVAKLIDPRMLVEIEAEAYVGENDAFLRQVRLP